MDTLREVLESRMPKVFKASQYPKPQRVEERRHKHVLKHICTFCGKSHASALRTCALCKSVRYCDKNCQTADYRSRHKEECINFADPPLTDAFLTEPARGVLYPSEPIFARAHANGVGYWVSVSGDTHCEMGCLVNCMRGLRESEETRALLHGANAYIAPAKKVHVVNLLTLQVLVQNRRKDKRPALIYGSYIRVSSFPESYQSVMNGKVEDDSATAWQSRRGETSLPCAAVGVASDPWLKKPRLFVKNFNGDSMPKDAPLPPAVRDGDKGVVVLNPGDFVILQMQFRVGDGKPHMSKDFHVLFDLHSLYLPVSIPNVSSTDTSSPALEMRELVRAFGASLALHAQTDLEPYGIRAEFDRNTMRQYYHDFIEHGEIAHVRSHYGEEKARALMRRSRDLMETLGELERRGGSIGQAADELRSLGLDGSARWLELAFENTFGGARERER